MGLGCNDFLGVSIVLWENISLYSLLIVVPPVIFLLFLLYKLRASLLILRETADVRTFRASSLAFLWLICIVNIARVAIQVLVRIAYTILSFVEILQLKVPYDNQEWKVLWIATRFGDTWLQVKKLVNLFLWVNFILIH